MAENSGANSLTTLDGMFKATYSEKMLRLIPEGLKLMNKIKFLPKDKQFVPLYGNVEVNNALYREKSEMTIPR